METVLQFISFAVTLGLIGILGMCLWELACTLAYIFWPKAPLGMKLRALNAQREAYLLCVKRGENLGSGRALVRRLGVWAAGLFVGYFFLPGVVFYLVISIGVTTEVVMFLALQDYKVEWID